MDYKKLLEEHNKFLNSTEGIKATNSFIEKIKREELFNKRWHNKIKDYILSLNDEELVALYYKYEKFNDKQRDILLNRGIDGNSFISSFLFKIFREIGKEYSSNDDTSIFLAGSYSYKMLLSELYIGQGSFTDISILK